MELPFFKWKTYIAVLVWGFGLFVFFLKQQPITNRKPSLPQGNQSFHSFPFQPHLCHAADQMSVFWSSCLIQRSLCLDSDIWLGVGGSSYTVVNTLAM